MHNLKYQSILKTVVCICFFLNASALTASPIDVEEHNVGEITRSRQGESEWLTLIDYSRNYIQNHQDEIVVEKNESGFYRINVKAPDSLEFVEKLRLHYWPVDHSMQMLEESIHDHPKFFESYIIKGGYRHALYTKSDSSLYNKPYTIFKVDKLRKDIVKGENIYLHEDRTEEVGEKTIVVMPTDVIHRVFTYTPGTLSMNIVYNDKSNKDYYNVFISEAGDKKKVKIERDTAAEAEKTSVIKEVHTLLLNNIVPR